jgi:energy-converting hydrogenase A subunit M
VCVKSVKSVKSVESVESGAMIGRQLKTARRQRGIGVLGMLVIAIMVGFFVMSAIRIIPGYVEYLAIRDIIMRVAEEHELEVDTVSDIRRKIADFFNTNQIYNLKPKDIEIERRDGDIIIDASYEERIPLFWRIDIVVKYDDIVYQAGEDYSD